MIIDHHEYQIFTEDLINQKADDRVPTICANAAAYSAKTDHWTVIGEWTGAMTDCAKYLNGYKRGSRWEGTYPVGSTPTGRSCGDIDDIRTWNQTLKDATSRYIKAQIDEYELKTQGWVFWNFKTQMSAEWDLERLLKAGLFPNVTKYQASPAC